MKLISFILLLVLTGHISAQENDSIFQIIREKIINDRDMFEAYEKTDSIYQSIREGIDDDRNMFDAYEKAEMYGDSIPFTIKVKEILVKDSTLYGILESVCAFEKDYYEIFPVSLIADSLYLTKEGDTAVRLIIEISNKRLLLYKQIPLGFFYYNEIIVFVFNQFPSSILRQTQKEEQFGWYEGKNVKAMYIDLKRDAKYYFEYKRKKYYFLKMSS